MLEIFSVLWWKIDKAAEGKPVKFFLEIASVTWAVSVFLGVIMQMSALSYTDLAFFSFAQAINDGAFIFSFLFSVLIGWILGYAAIPMVWGLLNLVKGDVAYLIAAVLTLFVTSRSLYLLLEFSKGIPNNIVNIWLIILLYALLTITTALSLHVLFSSISSRGGNFERVDVWMGKAKGYLVPSLLLAFLVFAVIFIRDTPRDMNKYHCVEWERQLLGIEYLNDKYVFTTNKLVLENKGRTFFRDTDCVKSKTDFYIRKDNECMKVDNFDKDFISVPKIGLLSNTGYDFYTNRECKTK